MTDLAVEVRGEGADQADQEDALRSLDGWLRADETLAGRLGTRITATTPAPADHMGTGFDMLELALGSSLSTAALVVSVLQWQLSRRRAPAVVLSRGDVRVELSAEAARDEAALRRVLAVLEPDGEGARDGDGSAS